MNETKKNRSKSPIPVVRQVADALEAHRLRMGKLAVGPIFQGGTGEPMNLDNLARRVIMPALSRCAICRKPEEEHKPEAHLFERVWRTKEGLPKTESSENTVPVLPILRSMLENYHHYLTGSVEEENLGKVLKPADWMFAGERRGTSMNLPNLVRRVIVPLLTRCSVCHTPKHLHEKIEHAFELDESIPKWKGWHCFRRSLASNLYALGVKPK